MTLSRHDTPKADPDYAEAAAGGDPYPTREALAAFDEAYERIGQPRLTATRLAAAVWSADCTVSFDELRRAMLWRMDWPSPEAIRRAGQIVAQMEAVAAQMTPRQLAEASWTPTSPYTVDQLEAEIRADRSLPARDDQVPA